MVCKSAPSDLLNQKNKMCIYYSGIKYLVTINLKNIKLNQNQTIKKKECSLILNALTVRGLGIVVGGNTQICNNIPFLFFFSFICISNFCVFVKGFAVLGIVCCQVRNKNI